MLLHHKCDILNVLRGSAAPIIFMSPFVLGLPEGYEIVVVIGLWTLLNDINHVLHLHIHHPFSTNKYFNLFLDISMGIATAMTAANWRIQHKYGHHKHYASSKANKWEMGKDWEMKEYTILGALSFSARTIFPIFFLPIIESFNKGILQNIKKPINYRHAFLEQSAFLVFMATMAYLNPVMTVFYLLPWYFLVHFVTRYTDYLNHVGCGESHIEASNNSLHNRYNKFGCNFGFHTAHHYKPSAHWSTLPEIHEKLIDKIPSNKIKDYSWSGFLMPYHFLLSLKGRM